MVFSHFSHHKMETNQRKPRKQKQFPVTLSHSENWKTEMQNQKRKGKSNQKTGCCHTLTPRKLENRNAKSKKGKGNQIKTC